MTDYPENNETLAQFILRMLGSRLAPPPDKRPLFSNEDVVNDALYAWRCVRPPEQDW